MLENCRVIKLPCRYTTTPWLTSPIFHSIPRTLRSHFPLVQAPSNLLQTQVWHKRKNWSYMDETKPNQEMKWDREIKISSLYHVPYSPPKVPPMPIRRTHTRTRTNRHNIIEYHTVPAHHASPIKSIFASHSVATMANGSRPGPHHTMPCHILFFSRFSLPPNVEHFREKARKRK